MFCIAKIAMGLDSLAKTIAFHCLFEGSAAIHAILLFFHLKLLYANSELGVYY